VQTDYPSEMIHEDEERRKQEAYNFGSLWMSHGESEQCKKRVIARSYAGTEGLFWYLPGYSFIVVFENNLQWFLNGRTTVHY
jgi:hypothetical protein